MSSDIVECPLGPKLPLIENYSAAFTNHQRRANENLEMPFTTPILFLKPYQLMLAMLLVNGASLPRWFK